VGWAEVSQVSAQLLQQALQLAHLLPATSTPRTGSSVADLVAAATQHQSLRLISFTAYMADIPGTLALLPVHSLAQLDIGPHHYDVFSGTAAVSAALTRLTCLQQLCISGIEVFRGDVLKGLVQLKQLTSLTLSGDWHGNYQPLQELLQQPLPLRHLHLQFQEVTHFPALDLSAQTQLEELYSEPAYPEGVVLPANLQRLQLDRWHGSNDLVAVSRLQQLQHLHVSVHSMDADLLLRLAQLPALQHLVMWYYHPAHAAATAHTWQQLSSLQELSMNFWENSSAHEMQRILAGVQAATSLTKLSLFAAAAAAEVAEDELHNEFAGNRTMQVAAGGCMCQPGRPDSTQRVVDFANLKSGAW
jgi:hypothetical protein